MNVISTKKEKNQTISVYVRVRPLNKQEISKSNPTVVEVRGKELTIKNTARDKYYKSFIFDKVFGTESQQLDVFTTVAEPAVAEILAGYNCTIFAYGQTGTGKTYTMAGGNMTSVTEKISWKQDENAGIIPRTLSYLFDELRVQQIEYTVRISYLELYNEEIFDLLAPSEDAAKLKLYDDVNKKGSVIVAGQTEISVASKGEVYKILESGAEKRRTAATLMNAQSSRSHTIFSVTVHTKESSVDGEDMLKTGKLNLVDLAGSENISKSGVTDKRARETSLVNASLLTLGRCIVALTEHRAHVPYRESKLTRLLRDSLGGRTKTSLIATISPALCNLEETLNTLDYASRAKYITNKPEKNQRLTKNALLKDYEDQIVKLQRDLQATRLCNGIYVASENYEQMIKELSIQKQEISEKINNIRALKEEMEDRERICKELKMEIEHHLTVVQEKSEKIEELETKLDAASTEIINLHVDKEEKEFLVAKHLEQEQILHVTAKKLLSTAESSTTDVEKLHTKLDTISELNKHNKTTYEQHVNEFHNKINQIQEKSSNFQLSQNKFHQFLTDFLDEMKTKLSEFGERHSELLLAYPEYKHSLNTKLKLTSESLNEIISCITTSKQSEKLFNGNMQETKNMLEANLIMTIEAMKSHLENQFEIINNIVEEFNIGVQKNLEAVKFDCNELKNDISRAKDEIYNKLDNINCIVGKIQNFTISSILDEQDMIKKTEQDLQEAMKILSETQRMLVNKHTKNKIQCQTALANLYKATSDLESCGDNIGSLTLSVINKADDIVNNSNLLVMDANQLLEKKNDKIRESALEGNAITNSTLKASKDLMDNVENKFHEQLQANSNLIDHLKTIMIETNNDTEIFIGNLNNKLVQHGELYGKTCVEANAYSSKSFNAIETKVCENNCDCSQYESHLNAELDECQESVKKLFTTRIKEYKPTGYTPIRKKYKYPKSVPSVISSEIFLDDLRSSKSEIPQSEEEMHGNTENENPNTSGKLDEKNVKLHETVSTNESDELKKIKFLSSHNSGNIPALKKN